MGTEEELRKGRVAKELEEGVRGVFGSDGGRRAKLELYWTEKDSHCTVHAVVVMM